MADNTAHITELLIDAVKSTAVNGERILVLKIAKESNTMAEFMAKINKAWYPEDDDAENS